MRGLAVSTKRIVFAAALFLTSASSALASPPPHQSPSDPGPGSTKIRIDAGCVGDTITGTVTMKAPVGEAYWLELSYRGHGRTGWASTGRSATFRGDGTEHVYSYSFDVSGFDAFAYRLNM